MTAEGDNRVLMMKVSKEYLATAHLPATKARLQAGQSATAVSGESWLDEQDTTIIFSLEMVVLHSMSSQNCIV